MSLGIHTHCSFDNTSVFNSAGMTFLLKQSLEIEIGFVALEEASLLLLVGAKTPALEVSGRIQVLERFEVKALVVVGAVEASPATRDNALEQELGNVVQVFILTFPSRHSLFWSREQSLHTFKHRWEQLGRTCHAPCVHQAARLTTMATRAATVKYRTTPTVAILWNFQVSVPFAITFKATGVEQAPAPEGLPSVAKS